MNKAVSTIIDKVNDLKIVHPSGAGFTLETTKRYLQTGIMTAERMHPGAVEYFKSKGVIK